MTDCIFCKIILGQAPSYKIYDDEFVIAILDQKPIRKGHAMVIPKRHTEKFIDLDDALAGHICKVGNMIGRKMEKELHPKRIGFVVSGFGVAHVHYHVIPMHGNEDITSSQYAKVKNGKIIFSMEEILSPNHDEQERLAIKLSIN